MDSLTSGKLSLICVVVVIFVQECIFVGTFGFGYLFCLIDRQDLHIGQNCRTSIIIHILSCMMFFSLILDPYLVAKYERRKSLSVLCPPLRYLHVLGCQSR